MLLLYKHLFLQPGCVVGESRILDDHVSRVQPPTRSTCTGVATVCTGILKLKLTIMQMIVIYIYVYKI